MILELNKQRVTSDYIELYKLQIPDGWLYFTTHETNVYMRDKETPFTNRLYTSLPIEFTGWEQKSEGTYARPAITFVNILTTFSDALNNFENDDLVGLKIVRRKTLAIHLDNVAGNAHGAPAAPTEYPTQSYIIDRVASLNSSTVTFELSSPFDVSGVTIPARSILPNTCCWAYQGAASDTPFDTPVGACTWKLAANNNGVTAYFDNRNSLFASTAVHALGSIPTTTAGGAHGFFKTAKALTLVNPDGTTTAAAGTKPFDYWQAGATNLSTAYRRMRPYSAYNGATAYYTTQQGDLYNDVVLYSNTVWVCIRSHASGQAPFVGSKYWKRADICGKKLSSCAIRYKSIQVTNTTGVTVSTEEDRSKVLQYGGFPASRRYGFTG